jgi:hypothetical protein
VVAGDEDLAGLNENPRDLLRDRAVGIHRARLPGVRVTENEGKRSRIQAVGVQFSDHSDQKTDHGRRARASARLLR